MQRAIPCYATSHPMCIIMISGYARSRVQMEPFMSKQWPRPFPDVASTFIN